jgi:hypothetical protein
LDRYPVPQRRQVLFLQGVWVPTESQGGGKPPHPN